MIRHLTPLFTHTSAFVLLTTFISFSSVYSASTQTDLTNILSPDDSCSVGTLKNGLRYYIKKNNRPEKQIVAQLIVKTGSIHEQDHEQGLAHFLEHVVFKGGPTFDTQKIFDDYFSSRGVAFIADTNASTSFDQTVYYFVLPTTDEDLTKKTFQALSDFAGRAFLRQQDIDEEKNIILDEIQMRSSSRLRAMKTLLPVLMANSTYPTRFPGGDKNVVSSATSKGLQSFYSTWYHPQNMAVIVVGDCDSEKIRQLIEENFSDLAPNEKNFNRDSIESNIKKIATPLYNEVVLFVDKENRTPTLSIFFDQGDSAPSKTIEDLRNDLINDLAIQILQKRLTQYSYQEECAAQGLDCTYIPFMIGTRTFTTVTTAFKSNKEQEAIKEILGLVKQFFDHGIHDEELTIAKQICISNEQSLIANATTLPHGFYLARCGFHFNYNAPAALLDTAALANLSITLLESINGSEINAAIKKLFNYQKAVYFLSLDETLSKKLGGEYFRSEVKQRIEAENSKPTKPYIFTPVNASLSITSSFAAPKATIEPIDVIEASKITLANGMVIYYKRANYTENFINIAGIAAGGFSGQNNNFPALRITADAIANMGCGGIKPYEWSTILRDKPNLTVGSSIDLHSRIIRATCRKEDLATCFQLMLTNMLQPNADETLFELFKNNLKNAIKNKQNSPYALFGEKNTELIFQHQELFKPLTEDQVDKTTLDDVSELYLKAFSNPAEFVYAVCGNISLEELEQELNKTLALTSLMDTNGHWPSKPVQVAFPPATERRIFEQHSQEQTICCVTFPCSIEVDFSNERLTQIYSVALNKRLIEELRQNNSLTYSCQAQLLQLNDLFMGLKDNSARLSCYATCNKDHLETVINKITEVIGTVAMHGFTNEEVAASQKICQNHLVQGFKNNASWNAYMLDRHMRANQQFDSIETLENLYADYSVKAVNDFAQQLINPSYYLAHSLVAQ